MLKITYVLGTLALHWTSPQLRNHDFTKPRFNTVSFGKHSYMDPKVWSLVPSNVKEASPLSSFKYNISKVDLSMLLGDYNCSNCSICSS